MHKRTHITIITVFAFLLSAASAFVLMDTGYSTYIGWGGRESINISHVDVQGNVYCNGVTTSILPVSANAYQKSYSGQTDGYIVIFNTDDSLSYLSYFGCPGDIGFFMVSNDSILYLAGSTNSPNLPVTEGTYQSNYGGGDWDCFVAKLNIATRTLIFCTYVGGSGYDYLSSKPIVDDSGYIYIAGQTTSGTFPLTPGAAQRLYGGGEDDAFVAKLSPDGQKLVYSTLIGGNGNDEALGLAVDSFGHAYVCGVTGSTNFPTSSSAFQDSINTLYGDCFVTKLSADGRQFLGSTYLGGQYQSRADGILLDSTGGIYITGRAGQGFPTTSGAFRQATLNPLWDGFIAKMSTDLSSLIYSTYAGGAYRTQLAGLARDGEGNVYVSGETGDPAYPVPNYSTYQPKENHKLDMLFAVFDPTLSNMLYGGVIGGSSNDYSRTIVLDTEGNLYLSGVSSSTDYPTTHGAFQETYSGGESDGVLVMIPRDEIILSAGQAPAIPSTLSLSQSYPNPVSSSGMVTIPYTVTSRGAGSITVFNTAGREVYAYSIHHETAGKYKAHFQLSGIQHGMYFYTLSYNNTRITRKMVVE